MQEKNIENAKKKYEKCRKKIYELQGKNIECFEKNQGYLF